MKPVHSEFLLEFVADASWDWVSSSTVAGIVKPSNVHDDPATLRTMWIGVVSEALARGLVEPGEIDSEGFHAWTVSLPDTLMQVITALDRVGIGEIGLGDVVWFNATAKGVEFVNRAIESGWVGPSDAN
jgi:hypothetical protein